MIQLTKFTLCCCFFCAASLFASEEGASPDVISDEEIEEQPYVDPALRWFVRHQSPNGMWDVDGYIVNCQVEGPKCEPGTSNLGADGDVGCTALTVLVFLGDGYDHKTPNKYRRVIQAGIDWLVANQLQNGGVWKEAELRKCHWHLGPLRGQELCHDLGS